MERGKDDLEEFFTQPLNLMPARRALGKIQPKGTDFLVLDIFKITDYFYDDLIIIWQDVTQKEISDPNNCVALIKMCRSLQNHHFLCRSILHNSHLFPSFSPSGSQVICILKYYSSYEIEM